MRLTALGLAAAALISAAAPAAAQPAAGADQLDARCVLIMNFISQSAEQKAAAGMATFYFLGRIDSRGATSKLQSLLVSERAAVDSEEKFKAELARCGDIMTKRTAELNAMYKRLQDAEPKPAAPAATPPAK